MALIINIKKTIKFELPFLTTNIFKVNLKSISSEKVFKLYFHLAHLDPQDQEFI